MQCQYSTFSQSAAGSPAGTREKLADAKTLPKLATDLAQVTERLMIGNKKPTIHSIKMVTNVSNLARRQNGM